MAIIETLNKKAQAAPGFYYNLYRDMYGQQKLTYTELSQKMSNLGFVSG